MADDGRRKKIINGVVSAIETATGATYFYDYSSDVVTLLKEPIEERTLSSKKIQVRVYDGSETTSIDMNNGTSTFDVIVQVTVRAEPSALSDAVQNALADLSRVIGLNNAPGGSSTVVLQDSVEAPQYDFTNRVAEVVMHLRAEYSFVPGVDT